MADCVVVSAMDPVKEGAVVNFHFCRTREEDGKEVKGCAGKVLSARNLAHYWSTKETSE